MPGVSLSILIESLKKKKIWVSGQGDFVCQHITSDTRDLTEALAPQSTLFFARRGVTRDGHEFLPNLEKHPAIAAFILEKTPENWKPNVPTIVTTDSTAAMAIAAKIFYGDPTASAFTCAVTGTNGKTTSTFLLQALMSQMGLRPARMGTIETQFENIAIPAELTTPDFTQIQKLFSDFKAKGASAFVFEASSHALEQGRLLGLELDAAVFTNLTPEHLDYHRTMENYYQSKKKLFVDLLRGSVKKKKFAVIPEDGSFGSRLIEDLKYFSEVEVIAWAQSAKASSSRFVLQSWKTDLQGSHLEVTDSLKSKTYKFQSKLVGEYNIENLMGVIALGLGADFTSIEVQSALDRVVAVSGRLERVFGVADKNVFVDYAHTSDALENVLMTLRPLTKGKLKVVFGCGGDRDRSKRPKMAAIAELYADEIFVTSDNPRTEDPDQIIQEILHGFQRIKPIHINPDRKLSIAQSLEKLGTDDVVLVAGKGHENYQILGTQKLPFDDREVVRNLLGKSKT